MKKLSSLCAIAAAVWLAGSFLIPTEKASAQSSLEQAWSACLKEAYRVGGTDPDDDAQRTATFKACMAKMGHAAGK